jgi:hypothetical protein
MIWAFIAGWGQADFITGRLEPLICLPPRNASGSPAHKKLQISSFHTKQISLHSLQLYLIFATVSRFPHSIRAIHQAATLMAGSY